MGTMQNRLAHNHNHNILSRVLLTDHRGKTIYTNVCFSAPSGNTEHAALRNRMHFNMDCLVTDVFICIFYNTVKIDSLVHNLQLEPSVL